METNNYRKGMIAVLAALFSPLASLLFTACVDNDDDVPLNYYVSTQETAAEFLENRPAQFSQFTTMLKRTSYFSVLSTYGTSAGIGQPVTLFTVFAPTNDAVNRYLQRNGYSSVETIPSASLDSLVRNHIIKKGAFFTSDIGEGSLPELNLADAYIVLSSDSDVTNNNKLTYFVNNNSRMIEYNDSVTNGVVHVIDNVLSPSTELLGDKIIADSTLTLFGQALKATCMLDSLTRYVDETYSCGIDSVQLGTSERCTSGGELYTQTYWVGKRYFKYTAFVEPDSVYHKKGIYTFNDLVKYAKQVYDQTYPKDAGLYDDDFTNRKNPLNRFVSYHLLDRVGQYDAWVVTGAIRECQAVSVADPEDYYETMCPHTLMRFCGPAAGLFINRKGLQNNASVRGVRVLSPSESGSHNALNGVYHYIDDILVYSKEVRDNVLNRRIRIDATTLSPDFMNCNGRNRYGQDILTGFKNNYITNWKVSKETFIGVHSRVQYWHSYQSDAVCVSKKFDVEFKLPPVPSGMYEIRLGYTPGDERGVIQTYIDNVPCGIPVDLRVYGGAAEIGAIDDARLTEEEKVANDKAMHNRGYMKSTDIWFPGAGDKSMRELSPLRRILTTQYLDENKDYHLRVRQVLDLDDRYWSFDYIELCPKSVYANPDGGEDRH